MDLHAAGNIQGKNHVQSPAVFHNGPASPLGARQGKNKTGQKSQEKNAGTNIPPARGTAPETAA
jgi:hypothetical protein